VVRKQEAQTKLFVAGTAKKTIQKAKNKGTKPVPQIIYKQEQP
jgi:hypothetical protein